MSSNFILQLHRFHASTIEMYAPSEMCREVREEDVESRRGNSDEEEEEEEEAIL